MFGWQLPLAESTDLQQKVAIAWALDVFSPCLGGLVNEKLRCCPGTYFMAAEEQVNFFQDVPPPGGAKEVFLLSL